MTEGMEAAQKEVEEYTHPLGDTTEGILAV